MTEASIPMVLIAMDIFRITASEKNRKRIAVMQTDTSINSKTVFDGIPFPPKANIVESPLASSPTRQPMQATTSIAIPKTIIA